MELISFFIFFFFFICLIAIGYYFEDGILVLIAAIILVFMGFEIFTNGIYYDHATLTYPCNSDLTYNVGGQYTCEHVLHETTDVGDLFWWLSSVFFGSFIYFVYVSLNLLRKSREQKDKDDDD